MKVKGHISYSWLTRGQIEIESWLTDRQRSFKYE